jgi:polyhydroxyalkanoate synthesis regulator phasin
MTDDEAKSFVEEKLRKQQMTKPMTDREMMRFCDAMLRYLELPSKRALSDIRGWVQSWQSTWFRTK